MLYVVRGSVRFLHTKAPIRRYKEGGGLSLFWDSGVPSRKASNSAHLA
jgi:hypothetical protein